MRVRVLLVLIIALIASFFSLITFSHASDYVLFGKELNITGHVSQEFGFAAHSDKKVKISSDGRSKYYDEPGLHSAYFTIYLDSTLWLTQDIHVRMINRLMGDWVYTMKKHNDSWRGRDFTRSNTPLHLELTAYDVLREFYINYMRGNLSVRVGKQQLAWGQADGIRLCDIINPLDISREALFRDSDEGYETTRIPLLLVRINYTFGGMSFGPIWEPGIEFVFNPGDIRTPRLFDYSIWSPHDPLLPPGMNVSILDDRPDRQLDHNEWGFRLKGNVCDTRLTFNFWRGYRNYWDGVVPPVRGVAINPATGTLIVEKIYPKGNSYGITATREWYSFRNIFKGQINPVLRLELLYQDDFVFNTTRFPSFNDQEIDEKDILTYMLGFDWPVKINLLNPERNIFISGQFFHRHIINYPDNYELQVGAYGDWIAREDMFYSTLLTRTSYFHDFVKPQVLAVVDWTYGTWWLKPKLRFEYGNNWRPEIGAIFVFAGANDYRREFGHWADRDEVYVKMTYQF